MRLRRNDKANLYGQKAKFLSRFSVATSVEKMSGPGPQKHPRLCPAPARLPRLPTETSLSAPRPAAFPPRRALAYYFAVKACFSPFKNELPGGLSLPSAFTRGGDAPSTPRRPLLPRRWEKFGGGLGRGRLPAQRERLPYAPAEVLQRGLVGVLVFFGFFLFPPPPAPSFPDTSAGEIPRDERGRAAGGAAPASLPQTASGLGGFLPARQAQPAATKPPAREKRR